ncbi:hypothetical protein [Fusobacterium sp. SYSU M8A802]
MNLYEKIEDINQNFYSRLNTYIYIKNVSERIEENENYKIISFEKIAKEFFETTNSSLTIFDTGVFFKYIQNLTKNENRIIIIDDLEIVENIIYNKDENGLVRFFNLLALQTYLNKTFFIITDIKKMKIGKNLLESTFPNKNIIWGL